MAEKITETCIRHHTALRQLFGPEVDKRFYFGIDTWNIDAARAFVTFKGEEHKIVLSYHANPEDEGPFEVSHETWSGDSREKWLSDIGEAYKIFAALCVFYDRSPSSQ